MIKFLRQPRTIAQSTLESCRGAKKKKTAEAEVTSNDIVNIFKDREDPKIVAWENYPLWLRNLQYYSQKSPLISVGMRTGDPLSVIIQYYQLDHVTQLSDNLFEKC